MISFDAAHKTVHYPSPAISGLDQTLICNRNSSVNALTASLCLGASCYFRVALHSTRTSIQRDGVNRPHGFPAWIRYAHFFNFFFVMMLIRSGLSILMDHPRLYFNDHCTPGTEWIRFTRLTVPKDRVWTAKDDARYISPLFALPGYRHTVGVARSWHFVNVYGFIITGLIFVTLLFATEQWRRIVAASGIVLIQAWNTFVH